MECSISVITRLSDKTTKKIRYGKLGTFVKKKKKNMWKEIIDQL